MSAVPSITTELCRHNEPSLSANALIITADHSPVGVAARVRWLVAHCDLSRLVRAKFSRWAGGHCYIDAGFTDLLL
jgi:hypothetical protein